MAMVENNVVNQVNKKERFKADGYNLRSVFNDGMAIEVQWVELDK